jgi:hypothetical protein
MNHFAPELNKLNQNEGVLDEVRANMKLDEPGKGWWGRVRRTLCVSAAVDAGRCAESGEGWG